jgi:hypothetical protein
MTLAFWSGEYDVRFGDQAIGSTVRPAVTALPNGGCVVGWVEGNTLKVQLFDGSGNPASAVTAVDAVGTGGTIQNNLEIKAIGNDSHFVVSWNARDTNNNFDLNTRIFSADLTAGAVKQLADNTTTHFTNLARISAGPDGTFVSTYMEGTTIRFKVHDAAGNVTGSVVLDSGSDIDAPEVTYIGQNKYVVSYGQGDNINFRIVDTTNPMAPSPLPGELPTSGIQGTVSEVVGLRDASGALTGQFAVVRHIQNTGQIVATFYDPNGNPLSGNGHPVLLTDSAYNGNDFLTVTALRGGRIAVAYSGQGPNDNDYVMLAIAKSDGSAEVPQRMVISSEGNQQDPRIAEMADGRLVIGWSDPTEPKSAISTIIVDPRIAAVTVNGTAGNDVYAGSEHNGNVLNGNGGNDKLIGGLGSDQMNGGADTDTVSYERSTAGVIVNLTSKSGSGGHAQGDKYDSIENITGSNFNDTLIGDAHANALRGGGGTDTVDYSSATTGGVSVDLASGLGSGGEAQGDTYVGVENAIGTNFADVLYGSGVANVLNGGGGNDILDGRGGADIMYGGAGDDTYHVDGADTVSEADGSGYDTVVTGASFSLGADFEALTGIGAGALALTGNALNNIITGNSAGNWIDGGQGADTMIGGGGDDTYVIDNAGDAIIDAEGINTVVLKVAYDLSKLPSSVNVTVADGANVPLTGTNGANVLKGNAAINTLKGQGGNDTIYGLAGNDKLYGGSGKDVFVFDTRPNKSTNVDKLYDFKSKDDSIWLDNAIFTKLGRGTDTGVKFKSDMFVEGMRAKDREDRIVYDKKTGSLYYDKDGTGGSAQVKIATLTNKTKLAYHDFLVI